MTDRITTYQDFQALVDEKGFGDNPQSIGLLVFNHDFAKAVFGEEEFTYIFMTVIDGEVTGPAYLIHLLLLSRLPTTEERMNYYLSYAQKD